MSDSTVSLHDTRKTIYIIPLSRKENKRMNTKKRLSALLCMLLACTLLIIAALPVSAAGPTVTTTLVDGAVQRGSKKNFDVWARNASGEKIKATVRLNGDKVEPTWDDNEKTSYTLVFTSEGANTVTVTATSDGGRRRELNYTIYYRRAADGEAIGTAVWSVEAFTLGCGYIVYPMYVPIYEGETAAAQLVRMLSECGFVSYCGGSLDSSFYLAYIADGTKSASRYNGYSRFGNPSAPRALDIEPSIPSVLTPYLESTMTYFDPNDYANWRGHLGEFVISNGSGWMYSVNNIFPNVGFADCYLSDGDVVRVQFTLGYGADIGGFGAMGTEIPDVDVQPSGGYFGVADKDGLTRAICDARASGLLDRTNVALAYAQALAAMEQLDASQSTVGSVSDALRYAVANPSSVIAPDSGTNGGTGGNTGGSGNHGTGGSNSGSNSSSGSHGTSGMGGSGSAGISGSIGGLSGIGGGKGAGISGSIGGAGGSSAVSDGSASASLPESLRPDNIASGAASGTVSGELTEGSLFETVSGGASVGKNGGKADKNGSTGGADGKGDAANTSDGSVGAPGSYTVIIVCVSVAAVLACAAVAAVVFRRKLATVFAPALALLHKNNSAADGAKSVDGAANADNTYIESTDTVDNADNADNAETTDNIENTDSAESVDNTESTDSTEISDNTENDRNED